MLKKRATIPAGKQQHRVESMAQSIYVGAWVPAFVESRSRAHGLPHRPCGCRGLRRFVRRGRPGLGRRVGNGRRVTADGSNFRPSVSAHLRSAAYLSSSGEPIHHHAGRGHRAASVKTEDGIRVSGGQTLRECAGETVERMMSTLWFLNISRISAEPSSRIRFVADDAFHAALRVLRGRRRLPRCRSRQAPRGSVRRC